ncbi:RnfABCDGE type electron transport complex subunit D [Plasticicumulans acidivorans]|uniref:Ion-translocating oxidoreductase complex subunit D n=1 Tax=Plasticicumulans acidivorans TaxID=886464 RepID=A0A317MQ26_9GAMM|nr:RnfABCDGE type electron transport complex subunit D [Plasticicumulans acidivorans]PWV58609.1 electron transport complex protein RnfD [Plasticicumulans acidivorans]
MSSVLVHAPHAHSGAGVGGVMATVMLALAPATAFGFWAFGWPAIYLWTVTVLACVLTEAVCLKWRGQHALPRLADGSAILTGWLLAVSLPPWAPAWLGVVGAVAAIALGKQVFGGLGQNPFNPAMVGRVLLLIAFPVEMTTWVAPHPLGSSGAPDLWAAAGITLGGNGYDAVTSASLLGGFKTELTRGVEGASAIAHAFAPLSNGLAGMRAGSLGETSAGLLLLGGLFLLWRGVIGWQAPVGMLLGVLVPAAILHTTHPDTTLPVSAHLFGGGLLLGAFFIVTDYVSSPGTPAGRLVFGLGCGLLTFVIRNFAGYPEGVAFAVMLMNAMTPLIDRAIRPRVYGRDRRGRSLPPLGGDKK